MKTMKTSSLSIGLVGAGTRLRGVVQKLIENTPALRVAAVYDPDPLSVQLTRECFGQSVRQAASEEELAADPEVDWVFIGSVNDAHSRQAVHALHAGKHVFCEKPLGITLEDCLAVKRAVQETGRTFAFGLVLRYSPHYQKLQSLVASGRIGRLVSFEFNETLHFDHGGYIFGNWRRNRALAGTHLLEKCCHDLDLANWIIGSIPLRTASFGGNDFFTPANEGEAARLGPAPASGFPAFSTWWDPHRVNPFSSGATIVDNQVAILQYANGVRATFHTNCATAIPERRFYLCGTRGTIRADVMTGRIELRETGYDKPTEIFDNASGSHGGGDHVLAQGLRDTLLGGKPPLASVDDGTRACIAAFGLDRAMDEGRVVDLTPDWAQAGISL